VRLILVRHGYAGRKAQWHKDDTLRPLSPRGLQQAERLAGILLPLKPTRIISSPFLRCIQTMAPLASRVDVDVEPSLDLAPDAAIAAMGLIRKLTAPRSPSGVVLCTHGEVMGAVLTEMAAEDGLELERRPPGLKGCAWVLETQRSKVVGAQYIGPR
jgi:broad specificity phosphatase PhoE